VIRPARPQARPLSGLGQLLFGSAPDEPGRITGITHDSRRVVPGDLYVALPGAQVHGAAYSAAAAAAGAAAILTDPAGQDRAAATGLPVFVVRSPREVLGKVACWVYGDPSAKLTLIGVTGTSGKSTTSYLVESGLRAAGHVTGLIGGVELRIGAHLEVAGLTTPEATDLQALLATMTERGVTAAAMEVSSHALALGRVSGTRYDVAIFTNLSQDHLDFHSDMEDYFAAKARLFTPEYSQIAVVNIGDPWGKRLAETATIPVTTFMVVGGAWGGGQPPPRGYGGRAAPHEQGGFGGDFPPGQAGSGGDRPPEAEWRAVDVRSGADGSTFRVIGPGKVEADASVSLPGPFNVANALGAIVALVEAGVRLEDAVAGVASCPGVPGRLQRVKGTGPDVFVDYSHKPGAVEAVLRALRFVTQGNLYIVLGCGGDRDRGKRPLMGAAAASLADVAVLTSDNPRSEDPLAILAAMLEGVLTVPPGQRGRVIVEPERGAAIGYAISMAGEGDVVVVAGKGHERGQYVAGAVLPFDDAEVASEALRIREAAQ
jgi:UDP-N-acetylmuramoyl-L-alanyl-D-glutamate--2,6-diaminopimelate ligase